MEAEGQRYVLLPDLNRLWAGVEGLGQSADGTKTKRWGEENEG